MPPPMSSTISRTVMPIGTSIRPPRAILPASENTLVPFERSVPSAANAAGALADDPRHAGERLDVVDERRLPPEPRLRRVRRPQPRHAPVPLQRLDERRLLAADERARALAHLQREAERAAEDPFAQQAGRGCGLDGRAHVPHRDRVLAPDVEEPLAGADRVGGNGQALDDAKRVAFEDGAIHERAGIALVAVADHVLAVAGRAPREVPLDRRREPGATAAAQTRGADLVDHRLRRPRQARSRARNPSRAR